MQRIDSLSRIVAPEDDFSCTFLNNQSTSCQSYQQIMRQIQIAEAERQHLSRTIKQMKDNAHAQLHQTYSFQIKTLNQQNQNLRQQLISLTQNVCETERSHLSNKTKKSFLISKKQKGQNKENKKANSIKARTPNKCFTDHSLRSSRRCSETGRSFYSQAKPAFEKSIFNNIIAGLLIEEEKKAATLSKAINAHVQKELKNNQTYYEKSLQLCEVSCEINMKKNNIQCLIKLLKEYQKAIEKTNSAFENIKSTTQELCQVKGTYIERELKCSQQPTIQKQLILKRQQLLQYKQTKHEGKQQIPSLQMLLKLFGVKITQRNDNLGQQYVFGLKNIQQGERLNINKGDMSTRNFFKEAKVAMQNLKEQRKKHKDLVELYLKRIQKISLKLKKYEGD